MPSVACDNQRGDHSVTIRVDSGTHVGGGHLLRCLTLADELRQRGASVRFISREHPGHLLTRVADRGYVVHRLPPPSDRSTSGESADWLGVTQEQDAQDTLAILRGQHADWLIVDHYGIDARWETLARSAANRVMVIDDLANRDHDADLLLDQNYFGTETAHRYERHVPATCRAILGPKYALLQSDYKRLRQSAAARTGTVRRILVFFGMNDQTRATPKVLQAMSHPEFAGIAVDVVVGDDPAVLAEVRSIARAHPAMTVYQQMPSIAALTARADLAIGACGATMWERACLGLPVIVATIADNQVALANAMAAGGFTVLVGRSRSASSFVWRIVLRQLIRNPERVAELARRARTLTDGDGAGRVALRLLGGTSRLVVRECTAADEWLLLEWANDAATRRFAFNRNQISAEEHHRWFSLRLEDPSCTILIGEDPQGVPLGQVRFDSNKQTREATINISVDVALRDSGIGTLLLREAVAAWRKEHPHITIVAEVVVGNEPSRRLFSSAGFAVAASRRHGTITFEARPG